MKDYSNYHQTNYRSKAFNDGKFLLEQSLKNSLESYTVKVNESDDLRKAILYDKYDENRKRRILAENDIVQIGNLITVANDETSEVQAFEENWLIVTLPEKNPVYSKADMEFCNTEINLYGEDRREPMRDEVTGKVVLDRYGKPVMITIKGEAKKVPIVFEMSGISVVSGRQMLVPSNSVSIKMQYQMSTGLNLNSEIELYGDTYQVKYVNKEKVFGDKGLVEFLVENVSNPYNPGVSI